MRVGMSKKKSVIPDEAPTILDVAKDLVYGDRNKTYGHPAENFQVTAEMWTAYLRQRMATEGVEIHSFVLTPEDVAMFMAMVKIARLANTPGHIDSLIDLAGYAATAARCLEAA